MATIDTTHSATRDIGMAFEDLDTRRLERLTDDDVRAQAEARQALYRYLSDFWLDLKRLGVSTNPRVAPIAGMLDLAGTLWQSAASEQLGREDGSRQQQPPLLDPTGFHPEA